MATVMSWRDAAGHGGQCDDRCHFAKNPGCQCMCDGRYHGAKLNGTFERIRLEHGQAILTAAAERARAAGFELEVGTAAEPDLWDFLEGGAGKKNTVGQKRLGKKKPKLISRKTNGRVGR